MVGHLQANKAARAVKAFAAIQSVDSVELAGRLDRAVGVGGLLSRYPVYLQVNVAGDPAKAGFSPQSLEGELEGLSSLPHLELLGLMTIGRLSELPDDARSTFARLRETASRLRARDGRLGAGLSMGMSDDFEVAVEEGATVLRIGRALFGDWRRP